MFFRYTSFYREGSGFTGAACTLTLVLAGEKDLMQPAHTRLIASSLPHGQAHILPGLTHYAPQEDPAAFNAAVLAFLGQP